MDLKQAKQVAKDVLETSKIVIVLSNKAIFHLDNESEIANIEEYAKAYKFDMFIVEPLAQETATEEVVVEDKKKKK